MLTHPACVGCAAIVLYDAASLRLLLGTRLADLAEEMLRLLDDAPRLAFEQRLLARAEQRLAQREGEAGADADDAEGRRKKVSQILL